MSRYVGAIDQGTTSSRFMVFDREGSVIALAQAEHAQIYPRPGFVEHDAREIWASVCAVIAEALARAGLQPRRPISGSGFQMTRSRWYLSVILLSIVSLAAYEPPQTTAALSEPV